MTKSFYDTCDEIIAQGAEPRHMRHVQSWRHAFELRTGAFGPEDPSFEARSALFWDDLLTSGGFARATHDGASTIDAAWARAFDRAERGIFRVSREGDGRAGYEGYALEDGLGGGAFHLARPASGLGDALAAASGWVDGRILADPDRPGTVHLLPGAFFHPREATSPIEEVLAAARARAIPAGAPPNREATLDALLRMERKFRSLSRVKASFAYRADALATPRAES